MEVTMPQDPSGNILGPPHLDYDAWKDLIRTMGGRFNPEGIEPKAFTGWVRPISVYGLTAAQVGSNARLGQPTPRDGRLYGADHYFAIFQRARHSALSHEASAFSFDVAAV